MRLSDEAHRAVGQVVANCQFFELAFIACAKLALGQASATEFTDVSPLSLKASFKQPVKAVLNELRIKVGLSLEFEALVRSVTERRHDLVHRWLLEYGWPTDVDDEGLLRLLNHATELSKDLNALTRLLVEALVTWLQRFPETSAALDTLGSDWRANLPDAYRALTILRPPIR